MGGTFYEVLLKKQTNIVADSSFVFSFVFFFFGVEVFGGTDDIISIDRLCKKPGSCLSHPGEGALG